MKRLFVIAALVAAAATGCSEPHSVMVKRPQDPQVDAAVTAMWSHEIHSVAQDGDWIVSRSYYLLADGLTIATTGEPLSHASIYDAKRDTIIESVGSGVREIPLSELVERNHYIIVIHPSNMTAVQRRHSVERARSRMGTPFDIGGMFGFDDKDKVYCSELVWWASQGELRTGVHYMVVTPGDLLKHGEVVYWSGKRTDEQVMSIAMANESRDRAEQLATQEIAAEQLAPEQLAAK
ncbi:MAG TPA: YiiX/YebB-like N1pC/P60 family cysteine hydrolase [Kofleriaceae bacterium]|nr:YiiX/YebB-like N1pC/P60 family cysteine hydrolase [Kofleriaceae bacterium]